jgi:hypothetical protein
LYDTNLGESFTEGTAASSAAALANPCKASIGAFRVARGRVSSDSSSEEGEVLGTIPYVAYLCGYVSKLNQYVVHAEGDILTGGANPGSGGKDLVGPEDMSNPFRGGCKNPCASRTLLVPLEYKGCCCDIAFDGCVWTANKILSKDDCMPIIWLCIT